MTKQEVDAHYEEVADMSAGDDEEKETSQVNTNITDSISS